MTLYTVATGDIVQAADIDQSVNWLKNFACSVGDYGAPTDGTTDAMSAVNDALAALYAKKGGVLLFPYMQNGYALASNIVIDVGQYNGGGGIIVLLMGNTLKPSHANWCIDIKTNYFGANNTASLGDKRVVVHGDGAVLSATGSAASAGAGGIRFTDTVGCYADYLSIDNYAIGTACQLFISTNDRSTWSEHNKLVELKGKGNLNGLYTKVGTTANHDASFLSTVCEGLAFQGTVNNAKLFNLEGHHVASSFISCGGYYNQGGATGGNGFYLNGNYAGCTFISPWIDIGETGTQSAATDIVFGTNYTSATYYQPVILNTHWIMLPSNWNTQCIVPAPILNSNNPIQYANFLQILSTSTTFYVSTTGNDSTGNGLTSGTAWATVSYAYSWIQQNVDCNGYTVTIQLADGTYTGQALLSGTLHGLGNGSVVLQGNSGTPGNVVISTTSQDAISVTKGAKVNIKGIKVATTTSGNGINVDTLSFVFLDSGNQFGACATRHIMINAQSQLQIISSYTITGNAPVHYELGGCSILRMDGGTVDATSRTFSGNFIVVATGSQAIKSGTSFTTTSSTGTRYYCYAGGVIQTFGAGATFFPGSVAGYADTASGGYYL